VTAGKARHCLAQEETVSRKQKNKPKRNVMRDAGDLDWKPLYRALHDSIEWALDVAAKLAAPYPEEVEAIENVRAFVRAKLAGKPAEVRLRDLMLAFGIIIAAIDRDLTPDGRAVLAPIRVAFDVSTRVLPDRFRIPAAWELWEPAVTRHCPGAHSVVTPRMPHVHYAA
jgi:hypothetical protein